MMRSAFGLSLLVSLGVMMIGCGDSGSSCDTGKVECDAQCIPEIQPMLAGANGIQESVFQGSCASVVNCHGTQGPQMGLELSSAAMSETNLVNVVSMEVDKLRVAPGEPANSYLMDKLLGIDLPAGTARMPNTGQVLCDAKIQAIEDWIIAGAN